MSDHVSSARSDAPRRVDLAIARIDAWTVMKVSFLLSVALGIAMVVATIVLWLMVDAMHVFSQIEEFLQTVGAGRFVDLLDYARLPRVISYATIVSVINVILLTALSTLAPCSTTSSRPWWAASRCLSWTSEGTRARGRLTPAPFAMPVCLPASVPACVSAIRVGEPSAGRRRGHRAQPRNATVAADRAGATSPRSAMSTGCG